MKRSIRFVLNGETFQVEIEPHLTLLQLLREKLGLTETKEGCGMGDCGACTVLLDGTAIHSCIFPAMEVEERSIITIEGLADVQGNLHPIQKAFLEQGAIQCGFCTPGMVLSAKEGIQRKNESRNKLSFERMKERVCMMILIQLIARKECSLKKLTMED